MTAKTALSKSGSLGHVYRQSRRYRRFFESANWATPARECRSVRHDHVSRLSALMRATLRLGLARCNAPSGMCCGEHPAALAASKCAHAARRYMQCVSLALSGTFSQISCDQNAYIALNAGQHGNLSTEAKAQRSEGAAESAEWQDALAALGTREGATRLFEEWWQDFRARRAAHSAARKEGDVAALDNACADAHLVTYDDTGRSDMKAMTQLLLQGARPDPDLFEDHELRGGDCADWIVDDVLDGHFGEQPGVISTDQQDFVSALLCSGSPAPHTNRCYVGNGGLCALYFVTNAVVTGNAWCYSISRQPGALTAQQRVYRVACVRTLAFFAFASVELPGGVPLLPGELVSGGSELVSGRRDCWWGNDEWWLPKWKTCGNPEQALFVSPGGNGVIAHSQLCARRGLCPGAIPVTREFRGLSCQPERDVCYAAMVRLTDFLHRKCVDSDGSFAPLLPCPTPRPHMVDVLIIGLQPSLQALCAGLGWHISPDLHLARPHVVETVCQQLVQQSRKARLARMLTEGPLGADLCSWLCENGRTLLYGECRAKQRVLLKAVAARHPAGFAAVAPELLQYTRSKRVRGRKERQLQWLEDVCSGKDGGG